VNATSDPRVHLVDRAAELLSRKGALAAGVSLPIPHDAAAPTTSPAAPATQPPITAEALARAGLVGAGRTRASEEVTIISNQLVAATAQPSAAPDHETRIVLVTSARPGEGKSFTAINVAARIATGTRRPVLLVDADGKRGCLGDLLDLGTRPGLKDLALDPGRRAASLAVPTALDHLSVMPCGATADGRVVPSQLLAAALRGLATAFPRHVLVVDTPPCLSASEAPTFASVAGHVVMVVEAARTPRAEVETALDLVQVCPSLQLVLNACTSSSRDIFGAYDYSP
jgi:protein-tyrosine kinase